MLPGDQEYRKPLPSHKAFLVNPPPEIIQKLHKEAREIEAERIKEAVTVQEAPQEAPRIRLR